MEEKKRESIFALFALFALQAPRLFLFGGVFFLVFGNFG